MSGVKKTSLNYERYELKYHIPIDMVDDISEYISAYCQLDHFSEISPDKYYVINSLYFDSPNNYLLENKRSKLSERYNMRVRSYGRKPKDFCFFEIKEKYGKIVRKKRALFKGANWHEVFENMDLIHTVPEDSKANLCKFIENYIRLNLEPKILTQYSRKAYFSLYDEYARVTFDKNLKFQYEDGFNIKPNPEKTQNYDDLEKFGGGGSQVILELKSYTKIPTWIIDLIKYFGLNHRSFSKYESSMMESYNRKYDFDYMRDFVSNYTTTL